MLEYLFSPCVQLAPRAPHALGFLLSPAFLAVVVPPWAYAMARLNRTGRP